MTWVVPGQGEVIYCRSSNSSSTSLFFSDFPTPLSPSPFPFSLLPTRRA